MVQRVWKRRVNKISFAGSKSSQVATVDMKQYTRELMWQLLSLDRYNPSNLAKRALTSSTAPTRNDSEIMLVQASSSSANEEETQNGLTHLAVKADANNAEDFRIFKVVL